MCHFILTFLFRLTFSHSCGLLCTESAPVFPVRVSQFYSYLLMLSTT